MWGRGSELDLVALNILLGSHHFLPSVGGIETVTELLGREFVSLGHSVHVVTQTPGEAELPFEVIRRPSVTALLAELKWCDVFLQNNISLRTWWPRLIVRRPFFITHQTWLSHGRKRAGVNYGLKMFVLRTARNFSISRAIAAKLPVPSVVVGNPYDDKTFRNTGDENRSLDLIFVGRLVSDKGADLLLRALAELHQSGRRARLTIVGDGPERPSLEKQAQNLALSSSITFIGEEKGSALADRLNRHRILVVPSRWPEPFGIVALEAIACGCVVAGSVEGGLPEAIGPCGLTFPNDDVSALTVTLRELLEHPDRVTDLRSGAADHLARFTRRAVAQTYLQEMERA